MPVNKIGREKQAHSDTLLHELHCAANQGDHQRVKQLLESIPDQILNGMTALHIALRKGYTAVVQVLLDSKKVDINQTTSAKFKSNTPLLFAMNMRHEAEALVMLLLEQKNIDVNKANDDGITPLHIAAEQGNVGMVKVLLDKKANPNLANKEGITALLFAAQKGYDEIVQFLLEAKVDVNQANKEGITPLYIATQRGHLKVVQLLVGNINIAINQAANDDTTPLFVAAEYGHHVILQLLINNQANIEQCQRNGPSPILIAAQNGHHLVVDALLKSGADPNALPCHHPSPLYIAAQNGHLQVVNVLLSSDRTDINPLVINGINPLYIAAQIGHTAIVKALLQSSKINPNCALINGSTAVFIAAKLGREASIYELVQHKQIDTSLACQSSPKELKALLAKHGKPGSQLNMRMLAFMKRYQFLHKDKKFISITPKKIAAIMGYESIVQMLDFDIDNPLYTAAKYGRLDELLALLKTDVDPNKALSCGSNPLLIAAQNGHRAIVEALLQIKTIDLHLYRNDGASPLIMAALIKPCTMAPPRCLLPHNTVRQKSFKHYCVSMPLIAINTEMMALPH